MDRVNRPKGSLVQMHEFKRDHMNQRTELEMPYGVNILLHSAMGSVHCCFPAEQVSIQNFETTC